MTKNFYFSRRQVAVVVVALLCVLSLTHPSASGPVTTTLSIVTEEKTVPFTVELAATESEQDRGLMFRTSLPERYGMIFDFHTPRPVQMWMKNTLIPLDMIFINNAGVITQIAERTTPESTAIIASGADTRAVLEVAGGTARQYHIAKGDKVVYPIFQ